jgi:hypothetical protein
LVDRMATSSHIAVMTPEDKREVLDRVRTIIDAVESDDLDFPYRVDVYWFERRP